MPEDSCAKGLKEESIQIDADPGEANSRWNSFTSSVVQYLRQNNGRGFGVQSGL